MNPQIILLKEMTHSSNTQQK